MKDFTQIKQLLQDKRISVKSKVALKEYTTLHIGGFANLLIEPETIEEIRYTLELSKLYEIPYLILGNGSNTLISDHGFDGIVIVLKTNFHHIHKEGKRVHAQSGADLKEVCLFACEHSLSGLEFAYGIPGSSGGTAYMNAGAYGGEVGDVISSCTYLDEFGELCTSSRHELAFSYRHSSFSHRNICILEVVYELKEGNQDSIKLQMDENMRKRTEKQPLEYFSAGSTFKRPQGNYASKLINDCGLKGYAHGDARVSEKHAGFLVNTGNASFQDFMLLIDDVKKVVHDKTGYDLECEVKIIE